MTIGLTLQNVGGPTLGTRGGGGEKEMTGGGENVRGIEEDWEARNGGEWR